MWLLIANSLLLGLGLAMDAFSVSVANGLDDPHMSKGRHMSIAFIFALFQMAMPMLGWILVVTVADKFAVFDRCVPYIALVLLVGIGIKMIVDSAKEIRRARNNKQQDDAVTAHDTLVATTDINADAVVENANNTEIGTVVDDTADRGTLALDTIGDCATDNRAVEIQNVTDTMQQDSVANQSDTPIGDDSLLATSVGQDVQQKSAPDSTKPARKLGVWGLLVQALATSIDALSVGFTIAEYNWAQALLCSGIIGVVTLVLCLLGVWLGRKAGGRFAGKAGIVGGVILIAIGIEIFVSGLL